MTKGFKHRIILLVLITACLGLAIQVYPVEVFYEIGTSPIKLCVDGEIIQDPAIGLNLSGGLAFKSGFSQLSLRASMSDLPIVGNDEFSFEESWQEYLGIGATLSLGSAVSINGNWTENNLSFGSSAKIGLFDFSAGTSWNPEQPDENRQNFGARFNTSMAGGALRMGLSTDWDFKDYSILIGGSVQVSFSGSFSIHQGRILNTSIRAVVFKDADGNQSHSLGESGVRGVRINLEKQGRVVKSSTTSGGGSCSFGELSPGTYYASIEISSLPKGFELTTEQRIEVQLDRGRIAEVTFGVSQRRVPERTTFDGKL